MAVAKESSKPQPLVRPASISSTSASSVPASTSVPVRMPHVRHNSSTAAHGTLTLTTPHRIARRKSATSANASTIAAAAVAAAVREAEEITTPTPRRLSSSRATLSKLSSSPAMSTARYPSPPNSLPTANAFTLPGKIIVASGSAVVDGPSALSVSLATSKTKRRASEGGKEKPELKCDTCGKGYKHGSCLTKHLWEHTPEWALTSKLLISKHQQVQLLEAASILVSMTPGDAIVEEGSDMSASPVASTFSDEASSAHTTPPPQADSAEGFRFAKARASSRHGLQAAAAQSAPATSAFAQFAPSPLMRPRSGRDEDEASLAAAVELLSCSFGTPKTGPVIRNDIPPMPPLPEKYLHAHYEGTDVDMNDTHETILEEAEDDTYVGVFGKMEGVITRDLI